MNAHTISAEMSFGSAVRRSLSCYMFKSETRRPLPHRHVCFKQTAAAATLGTSWVCVFSPHSTITAAFLFPSPHPPKRLDETLKPRFISDQREKLPALCPTAEAGQSFSFSCVVASSVGPLESKGHWWLTDRQLLLGRLVPC